MQTNHGSQRNGGLSAFADFLHSRVAGSVVLLLCTIAALVIAHSVLADQYFAVVTSYCPVKNPDRMESLKEMFFSVADMRPAGLALEQRLQLVQALWILPIFAFFNAGVRLLSRLAVKSRRASLTDRVTWGQIPGVGVLAGVVLTMSIFISKLAFEAKLVNAPEVGILVASVTSGVIGCFILARMLPRDHANHSAPKAH